MMGTARLPGGTIPKLRIDRSFTWDHHRDGWGYIVNLFREHFVCDDGVLLVTAVEDQLLYHGPVTEPWVGVVHQVPHHDLPRFPDVARLLEMEAWRLSEPYCLGVWTLCDYVRQFMVTSDGARVPVNVLPYVSSREVPMFDWDRFVARERPRLLHIGEFLRNYRAFFDLDLPGWQKQLLEPEDWPTRSKQIDGNGSVEVVPPVQNDEYDALLQESIVFLDLIDAPANTTVVECMARATPICVNKVGGVVEYLGRDYPLYHADNAAKLLDDRRRLKDAHAYLLERRQATDPNEEFVQKTRASEIYLSLPTPPSRMAGVRS